MTSSISLGDQLGAGLKRAAAGRDEAAATGAQPPGQSKAQRPTATDAGPSGTDGARGVLAALLNRLSVDGAQAHEATAPAPTDAAPRPNLDALNRVLNHYAAQSAAATLPFVVLDP